MGGARLVEGYVTIQKNVQGKKEITKERKDLLHMYGFLESDTPLKNKHILF